MKKRKKYILFLLIILMICLIILSKKSNLFQSLYDDILFIRAFQEDNSDAEKLGAEKDNGYFRQDKKQVKNISENGVSQYVFDVSCKDSDFCNVSLSDTILKNMNVKEKIAPGLEGKFEIVLKSNEDISYNVVFNSQSEKPKNLKFQNLDTMFEANTLEELGNNLYGNLHKNETKILTIRWYWPYENTEDGNKQDTKDSKNITNYLFMINAIGVNKVYK